ncbi:MAG: carboxypeptidase regulatory-like domain-containing protein [Polyangiaceae bacterium]|nr:carboxypeptidase regulatory-like domain-containing protein [Polyangiaceae bacterium]
MRNRWRSLVLLGCIALVSLGACWLLREHTPEVARASAKQEPSRTRTPRVSTGTTDQNSAISIRGTVRSSDGGPIAAATVCLLRKRTAAAAWMAAWATLGCARTDHRGEFGLGPVLPSDYALTASAEDHTAAAHAIREQDFPRAPNVLDVDLVLNNGGARVSGIVVDATGGPVSGAVVLVKPEGGTSPLVTRSEASGRFKVFVAPGLVDLVAEADGYSRARTQVVAPCDELRLTLAPGSTIAGRVLERASSQPVAGVAVTATRTAEIGLSDIGSAESDASGQFRITGLFPGQYEVAPLAKHWRGASTQTWVGPVESSPLVVLYVDAAACLDGEVRVGREPCVEGAVRVLGGEGEQVRPVDADGSVHFAGLKPGRYSVVALCEGSLPKEDSLELVAGDNPRRAWELETGLSVRGTVLTASGGKGCGVSVMVSPPSNGATAPARCMSDDNGRFECRGLRPGTFDCAATEQNGLLLSDPVPVTLEHGSVDSVVLRLRPAATIRAVVRTLEGKPRGNTVVYAQTERGMPRELPRRGNGEYVLDSAELGSYLVFEGFPTPHPQGKTVRLDSAGQVVTVELVAKEPATITGRVVDDQGHPVTDAWVAVVPAVPRPSGSSATSPVLTDSNGEFELSDLLSGCSYRVRAKALSGEAVQSGIVAGTDVTLQMQTYASVSGHVRDPAGRAVEEFTIDYENGRQGTGRTFCDPQGAWQLTSLLPGKWTLTARSSVGEATQVVDLTGGADQEVVLTLSVPSVSAGTEHGSASSEPPPPAPSPGGTS